MSQWGDVDGRWGKIWVEISQAPEEVDREYLLYCVGIESEYLAAGAVCWGSRAGETGD